MSYQLGLKPLLWVPRYWPAIGGAELHTRRLAHELALNAPVGVLTHCDKANINLAMGVCESGTKEYRDGDTRIYKTGLHDGERYLLGKLAALYVQKRFVRPIYAYTFKKFFQSQVSKIVRGYDLVHFVYNGLTESAELAAAIAARHSKPFILTPLACINTESSRAWSSKRFRRLYARADALIALTNSERNWLVEQGADENKVYVVPYGPLVSAIGEGESFRQRFGLGDAPLVVFLGRVTKAKGCDYLLQAAPLVWQRHPHTRFAFIGPQDDEARSLLKAYKDPRVLQIETITDHEKSAALQASEVLCVPSRAESLGVAYLEAWYFKKPVVALDLPVLREVIGHNQNGLLVEHSSEAVANGICRILSTPILRKRLGDNGRANVLRQYDWNNISLAIASVYRHIIKSQAKKSIIHSKLSTV